MKVKRPNLVGKIITVLLILQTVLICVKAENRIQQGDSTIEVLIWMINQYIPVLKQASRLKDNDKDDKHNKCADDIKN